MDRIGGILLAGVIRVSVLIRVHIIAIRATGMYFRLFPGLK
jgi:hypothetical protein